MSVIALLSSALKLTPLLFSVMDNMTTNLNNNKRVTAI